MKRILSLLLLIQMLFLSGCNSTEILETATSKIPVFTVTDQKDYFDFNVTIAFNHKIYSITDEFIGKAALEEPIAKIRRDVTSHALLDGDYGFHTLKKDTAGEPYMLDPIYQKLFLQYKNAKLKGNKVYKIMNISADDAIALEYGANQYRKFTYLGEMNDFYKTVEKLIQPFVFVPILVAIFVIFLIVIIYVE